MLDTIINRLNEILDYLNQVRSNSKRIDELPNATSGYNYIAVFNPNENAGTGGTQKITRDALVNQNNVPVYRNIGALPGNGVATASNVASQMNLLSIVINITEQNTPVLIECTKINGTSNIKYIFLCMRGKSNLSFWSFSDFRWLSQTAVTAADINPGPNVVIEPLGLIANQAAFLAAANADNHVFDDEDITYYLSYSIVENEGTPLEQTVLYLAQFVGTPGSYGGASPDQFVEEDFVDTYSTGEQYVTNQDNITIIKEFDYDNTMSPTDILDAINSISAYDVDETEMILFKGINTDDNSKVRIYKMLNKGKGTYGLTQTQLTIDDLELIFESPIRQNFGKIWKIGKGYTEDMSGVITANAGDWEEDEAGDNFAGIDDQGFYYGYMRYGGTGDPYDFANQYYETGTKVSIPGEPNYSG